VKNRALLSTYIVRRTKWGLLRVVAATKHYSVVEYFSLHKSYVFICSMDAVKAFDTVNHFGLLVKVGKRGACKDIFLLLVCWFSNLTFSVQWDNFVSQPFTANQGSCKKV
jgi:hypothetical protein